MGYIDTLCQLCGVSFGIARIRRPDEPLEAAWDYLGERFVETESYTATSDECDEGTGCETLEGGDRELEHVAGPGCLAIAGYSGHRISLEEMKGCRAIQALMRKRPGWQPEPDDQEFEISSEYFLTGLGDGSPDPVDPLEPIVPARHGVSSTDVSNFDSQISSLGHPAGVPFHPTCFEIFKRVSWQRLGKIDVDGLFEWRDVEEFRRNDLADEPTQTGQGEFWQHQVGHEYLVANPIEIPGLSDLLKIENYKPYGTTTFGWPQPQTADGHLENHAIPPPRLDAKPDLLSSLPPEISSFLLSYLGSKDIANLRLASPLFRQLPTILFRRLLLEDMPWMWEVEDLAVGEVDWHALYLALKKANGEVKGLRNRERVWRYVERVCGRIEWFRGKGRIG